MNVPELQRTMEAGCTSGLHWLPVLCPAGHAAGDDASRDRRRDDGGRQVYCTLTVSCNTMTHVHFQAATSSRPNMSPGFQESDDETEIDSAVARVYEVGAGR